MGKTSGIIALLASQLLSQHADAYAIDSSCTSFSGKSGADMSSMIEAAMSEAQKLATLGMNSIDFAIFDPSLGLAEGSLWRSPSTQDISDIKRESMKSSFSSLMIDVYQRVLSRRKASYSLFMPHKDA